MTTSLIRDLRALFDSGFTGTLTLHFERGTVKQVEKTERWRPEPDDGLVDLSERASDGFERLPPVDHS